MIALPGLLGDTTSGFAGMAFAFTLFVIGAAIVFGLTVVYGVVVSSRFLRTRYPECSLWRSRWIALLKQLLGYAVWGYFGSASMEAFFIDAHHFYRWLHAIPCAIALYLVAFALLSHALESSSPRTTATNAASWVVWDFLTISLPMFVIARLIHL